MHTAFSRYTAMLLRLDRTWSGGRSGADHHSQAGSWHRIGYQHLMLLRSLASTAAQAQSYANGIARHFGEVSEQPDEGHQQQ